jgi:putative salt-induced outer membrane protein
MKLTALSSALLLVLPLVAQAADPTPQGWSGSGEAGLAVASGNAKSENVNAKLSVKYNDDQWKDEFYLEALRNKSTVTTYTPGTDSTGKPVVLTSSKYDLTSDRYDAGASLGYKLDEKSYIVGAARYDHDAFSPYQYQYIASIGYGYQMLKNARDELAFEVGPGYKVIQPLNLPGAPRQDSQSGVVARGKMEYKHNFNDTTSFVDTFLVESGSGNTFLQNDAGVQVKMSDKLGLKVGYQVRHNSEVQDGLGLKKTDQLLTTNLVYGF